MLTAFLADIHGNIDALEAVLDEVERLGVDRIVCLGDIVGYGAEPAACIARIAALMDAGAACVRGNHDAAVSEGTRGMSETAAEALRWTQDRLGPGERAFLSGLPLTHLEGDVLCVHASPQTPERWIYVTSADEGAAGLAATGARLSVCGHTHVPMLFSTLHGISGGTGKTVAFRPAADKPVPLSRIRRHLAVMGAVGQPRDGDPRAAFGLHDGLRDELTWRRVPYDVETAAARIRAAGLPERLAGRLLTGR